LISQREKWTKC